MYKPSEKLQIIKKLKKLGYGGYFGDALNQLEQQQFTQEAPTPAPIVNTLPTEPTEPTESKKKKKEKQSYTFNQNAMQNWIDKSDALFRNSETGLLEGEENHRDDVQSLYNSFMDADKHWLTKKENSHEAVPWSAATITNGIQAMYNLSDKEIKKALDPKNKGLYRHSTYINSSINAGEDGMFIASDIKNQNIGNMPIGSILFTGRVEAENWDYDTIAKKAEKNSKYKAHSDFITAKGKDEIGYYVITTGGNRKNPDDKTDESFVSKKLYYDPETGAPIGFYNKKNKNFKSSTGKETKNYYKGILEPNQKYVTNAKIDPLYSNENLPQVNIEAQAGEGLIQMPTLKPKQISGPNRSAITSNESIPEVQRRYQDAALTRASTLPTPPLENEIDRSAMVNTSPKPKYTYVPEPEPEPKVEILPEVSIKPKVKITPEQKAAYERYIRSKNNSNNFRNLDTKFANGGFIKTKAPQRYVGKAYQDRKHHTGFMEGDLNMYMANGGELDLSPQGGPKAEEISNDYNADGMMKARLAYEDMHGNPAAKRMVAPTDNPYVFPYHHDTDSKKKNDTDSEKKNHTVVYGGMNTANPEWMKKQWEEAGLSTDDVTFLDYRTKPEKLDKLKEKYNVNKIFGYSAGGSDVWREIQNNADQYDYIGLIDPTTNKYTDISNMPNVHMVSNSNIWKRYPNIYNQLLKYESGDNPRSTTYLDDEGKPLSHKEIPLRYFQEYKKGLDQETLEKLQLSGELEGETISHPSGDHGTHYMGSYDNYAIPSIQNVNGKLEMTGPRMDEAMKFDRPEDAERFAKGYEDEDGNLHGYKRIAPAFRKAYGGPLSGSNSGGPKKKKGTVGIKSTDSFMSNAYFNETNDGVPFKSNMGEIIDLNLPQPDKNSPIRFNPYVSGNEKGMYVSGNASAQLTDNLSVQGGVGKYYDFSPEAEESEANYNLGLRFRFPNKKK